MRNELTVLEAERARIEATRENEADRTRQLTILNGRLSALNERVRSAKLVDPRTQPAEEIRFGATVTLRPLAGGRPGSERRFTIVGVDEGEENATSEELCKEQCLFLDRPLGRLYK